MSKGTYFNIQGFCQTHPLWIARDLISLERWTMSYEANWHLLEAKQTGIQNRRPLKSRLFWDLISKLG